MAHKEAQTSGEPRTAHTQQRQEQREGQPLPNVWNFLELNVMLDDPVIKPAPLSERWFKIVRAVWDQGAWFWFGVQFDWTPDWV